MKSILSLLTAAVIVSTLPLYAQAPAAKKEAEGGPIVPEPRVRPFSLETEASHHISLNYMLYLPGLYNPKQERHWPLIVFLHGSGERGSDVRKVAVHGPLKVIEHMPEFPFIVAAPQCPANEIWDDEAVLALVRQLETQYKVDPDRIYLTGLSMGGFGTWSLAVSHPEKWAAVAPICGGGDTIGILCASPAKSEKLRALPVWAFHGEKDNVVPHGESERMINAFKAAGDQDVRLTLYPEAGHDAWTKTYDDGKFYAWLLEHNRKENWKKEAEASRNPGNQPAAR